MKNKFEQQVKRDIRRQERKKGGLFRICIFLFCAFIIWVGAVYFCVLGVASAFSQEKKPVEVMSDEAVIEFANVNWNEDIYRNERWLERDRQIYFGTQNEYSAITEETATAKGAYAEFFYRYFQSIIAGDAEGYSTFFSSEYPRLTLPQKFTMQKLFEIYALEYSGEVRESDGSVLETQNYLVEYKILENNGTFRSDLPSSVSRKELYRLTRDENGAIKIHSILQMQSATLENYSGSINGEVNWSRVGIFGFALAVLFAIPLVFILLFVKKRRGK